MSWQATLLTAFLIPGLLPVILVLLRQRPNWREFASLSFGLILLALLVKLLMAFQQQPQLQLTLFELFPGLSFAFTIEPIGLMFALVAGVLWPITTLYAIGYLRAHNESKQTQFYCFFAIAIFSVIGIAFAANLLTLFIFYELLTLCTFPLVSHAGTDKAKRGGRSYLAILLFTSIMFFLLAVIGTWITAGSLEFKQGGVFNNSTSTVTMSVLLVLFVFGVGKAATMPFHRWLPAAMVAPTPVSALLHAVAVVKAGVVTLIKICLYIFDPQRLAELPITPYLLHFVAFSLLIASFSALKQTNLKARLAYSTISQLSYITMGALLASSLGFIGSSLHIIMHAFSKITLFFCAGVILVMTHKTNIEQLHGIGKKMPLTMLAFFIASLGIIGLPPAGGSWSKWFLLMATADSGYWFLMLSLLLSSLLSVAYLLNIPLAAFITHKANNSQLSSQGQTIDLAPTLSLIALLLTASISLGLFFYSDILYQFLTKVV